MRPGGEAVAALSLELAEETLGSLRPPSLAAPLGNQSEPSDSADEAREGGLLLCCQGLE